MLKKLLLPLLFVFFSSSVLFAQTGSITGKVTNGNGEPIPTANVLLMEINRGAATNLQGKYVIQNVEPGTYTLRVSFVGYKNFTTQVIIEAGETVTQNVTLQAGAIGLEELVVTGFGTMERKNLTSAIASVDQEAIETSPAQSVDALLQGKVAGVLISQNSGTPGGSSYLRIRGTTSISADNSPLYIVDGVPIASGSGSAIGLDQQLNALSSISPSMIASIEILKGAVATAKYGTRGANGVVIITTKGGQAEDRINVSYSHGIKHAAKVYDMLNSEQFIKMYVDGIYADIDQIASNIEGRNKNINYSPFNPYDNWGDYQNRYQAIINLTQPLGVTPGEYFNLPFLDKYGANPASAPTTDWMDAVFRGGITNKFSINASGGNENTTYFAGGSYYNEKAIMIGSAFEKLNGRLNVSHQFNEQADIDVHVAYLRTNKDRIHNDNDIYGVFSNAILSYPTAPVYNNDGTYNQSTGGFANPVASAHSTIISKRNSFIGSVEFNYDILDHLVFTGSAGLDRYDLHETIYNPSFTSQGAPTGNAFSSVSYYQTWITKASLNYTNIFNDVHDLSLLAYASLSEGTRSRTTSSGTGFPTDDLQTINSAANTSGGSFATAHGLTSFFGQINYIYDNKYILLLSGRLDGSSRFGSNNQYAFFPAVGVAWRVANESFMENVDWISSLKVRAGYGVTGNQRIGNFSWQALWTGASYSGVSALAPEQIPNPNLKWEETTQVDGGIDVGLFDERVNFTFNVYYKRTNNLLLNRPIPLSTGFSGFTSNIGVIENKGIEFSLSADVIRNEGFRWTTTLNISANRNNVVKLYQGQPLKFRFASWVMEGEPIGTFRGYVTNGLWNSQQEIDEYLAANPNRVVNARPGDVRFVDVNDDGVVNSDDKAIIGYPTPDFYGGFRSVFSYKGFELNAFFQFSYGGKVLNETRAFNEHFGYSYAATTTALKRWTPENKNTSVYRASKLDLNQNTRNSDLLLEDGSYMRLETLTLAYNFQPQMLDKLGLRTLKLYVTGHNLFTLTNYSGLDPEVNTFSGRNNVSLSQDFFTFPPARTFAVGINLGF